MVTLEEAWKFQEDWPGDQDSACFLDLRARVEALEQRAAKQRRINNPVQIAECGGPCTEGGPDACDCGALVVSAHGCADTALPAPAATEESSATDVDSALLRTGMVTAHHLATIKESLTVEPAPAPERPLWQVMRSAYGQAGGPEQAGFAAEIEAVADWLAAREYTCSASLLRIAASRAREGA